MLSNMQIASNSIPRTPNDLQLLAQALLRNRLDLVFGFSLFFASLTLYVRTLAPSLLEGDSAEFQTLAYTLGIGHPTGYPVYILLAKLFTLIPIHDIAYRVNLFSAFCAALTVGLVFFIIRKLSATYVAAVYGSLTLASMPLFWKFASIAEVYTPSAACLALILLFVLQWNETHQPRWLFLAGLCGGLSLGIHFLVAMCGAVILIYLALSTRQRTDWLHASLGAFVGVMIFLSSLLLLDFLDAPAGYYNAVVRPSLSGWDMTPADFDSPLEHLAFLYFPPQFTGQFFSLSYAQATTRLTDFIREASWTRWLALLGFIALLIPYKVTPARWREAMLLSGILLTFLGFVVSYDVLEFYVFFVPPLMILVIFIGLGVNTILKIFTFLLRLPRAASRLLGIGILMTWLYPSALHISAAWKERAPPMLENWESDYYEFPGESRLKAEQVVNSIEDNAIVFTGWRRVYAFYYVAHVLQGRTGIDVHETLPQEGIEQLAASTIQYIEANLDTRPIYSTSRSAELANYFKLTRAASGLFRIERK
jgi:hypothetical protein